MFTIRRLHTIQSITNVATAIKIIIFVIVIVIVIVILIIIILCNINNNSQIIADCKQSWIVFVIRFGMFWCNITCDYIDNQSLDWSLDIDHHHTTCTVAKALKVTFFGNSGPGEPRVLMTGFKGCRGFKDSNPAEAANSLSRWEKPGDVELLLLLLLLFPSLLPLDVWPALPPPSKLSHPLAAPPLPVAPPADECRR